jgi:hypothetical protein
VLAVKIVVSQTASVVAMHWSQVEPSMVTEAVPLMVSLVFA